MRNFLWDYLDEPEINIHEDVEFNRAAKFGRFTTFKEDIEELQRKWKYTKAEPAVGHMLDSLTIFLHNADQYNYWLGMKDYRKI